MKTFRSYCNNAGPSSDAWDACLAAMKHCTEVRRSTFLRHVEAQAVPADAFFFRACLPTLGRVYGYEDSGGWVFLYAAPRRAEGRADEVNAAVAE